MNCDEILGQLKSMANAENVAGMARFGINSTNTLGVSVYVLRDMAKKIGTDHGLACELWDSGIHEARILAGMIDNPAVVTEAQLEKWVLDFDSWDVCDQCCSNLFDKTPFAHKKAVEWTERDEEFVKRAGFVMMAALSVHDKAADNEAFEKFFPIIVRESTDSRNFVKKAVNWALRNIGKRNIELNRRSLEIAEEIKLIDSSAARWIASDAIRELAGEKVQARLRAKKK